MKFTAETPFGDIKVFIDSECPEGTLYYSSGQLRFNSLVDFYKIMETSLEKVLDLMVKVKELGGE